MHINTIQKMSFFGALFTLVVIGVGAWVRLTDAGLGCPDWPGCYGLLSTPDSPDELSYAKNLYPDANIDVSKAFGEMLHRYVAGILGLYVFLISYLSIKYVKHVSNALPVILVILIIVQSIMGMLTVTELVKPTIVTTHLLLGMLTATLLCLNGLQLNEGYEVKLYDKPLVIFIILCIISLLVQIILGGWTSTNYASLACTDFPRCLNQWWPSNMDFNKGFTILNLPDINYEGGVLEYNAKVAIHFSHRLSAVFLSVLYIGLFSYIFFFQNNKYIKKIGMACLLIFLIQIFLGIANVVYSLPISIAVLHTANAALLLASMVVLLFYSTYNIQKDKI